MKNWLAKGVEGIVKQDFSLLGDDIRVTLTRGYMPTGSEDFLSSLVGVEGTSCRFSPLTGKTQSGFTFSSDDATIGSIPVQTSVDMAWFYADVGGSDSTRRLIFYSNEWTGFPFTPTGAGFTIKCPVNGWGDF